MKYLLDTNIYIEACRSEKERARFRLTYFPLLPATFLSAVVAYELYVSAQDRRTRAARGAPCARSCSSAAVTHRATRCPPCPPRYASYSPACAWLRHSPPDAPSRDSTGACDCPGSRRREPACALARPGAPPVSPPRSPNTPAFRHRCAC
jgi:hypothetical protein